MITVIARSFFREENLDEVLAVYRRLVDQTRREPGCRRYELFQDPAHPGHFAMVEEWETEASLKAHTSAQGFLTLVGDLRPLASSPSELSVYTRVL